MTVLAWCCALLLLPSQSVLASPQVPFRGLAHAILPIAAFVRIFGVPDPMHQAGPAKSSCQRVAGTIWAQSLAILVGEGELPHQEKQRWLVISEDPPLPQDPQLSQRVGRVRAAHALVSLLLDAACGSMAAVLKLRKVALLSLAHYQACSGSRGGAGSSSQLAAELGSWRGSPAAAHTGAAGGPHSGGDEAVVLLLGPARAWATARVVELLDYPSAMPLYQRLRFVPSTAEAVAAASLQGQLSGLLPLRAGLNPDQLHAALSRAQLQRTLRNFLLLRTLAARESLMTARLSGGEPALEEETAAIIRQAGMGAGRALPAPLGRSAKLLPLHSAFTTVVGCTGFADGRQPVFCSWRSMSMEEPALHCTTVGQNRIMMWCWWLEAACQLSPAA